MADIDSLIAGSGRTQADFNAIPGIATSYWEGLDQGFKNKVRNVFSNGLPTKEDGSPDFGEAAKRLYQVGDIGNANTMSNLDIQRQQLSLGQDASRALGGIENGNGRPPLSVPTVNPGAPPSLSRSASTVVAPPINQGRSPQAQPGRQSATVMQVLTAQGIPNDQLGPASASIARQLGLDDPNAQLDLTDPQVRNVLGPAIAQLKRMGIGQVVGQAGPQGPQPQQAPQQAVPPAPVAAAPPPQVMDTRGTAPTTQDPNIQARMAQYTQIMSNPALPQSVRDAAKARLEALQKNSELTGTQKEYENSVRQGYKGTLQDFMAETESRKSVATEQAKSDVKEQTDIIAAGRTAQNRLATLNTISNIVSTDKNLTQGFGADTALKVKMALEQMGVPKEVLGDLSGAQAIQKLNAVLASESTKAISPRPAQFEFRTFLANNPGLNLDKAGNERVIGIYSQLAKREVDLGRLARQNRDNWDNWDQIVADYDKKNPMRDPKTGQPITTDTIIAPGKGGDVFEKARAAIAQGAPRDAVIKRLKENGHDPAGL